MKTTKLLGIFVLALGFMVCPAQGNLTLPFGGSADSFGPVFKITNTNTADYGIIVTPGGPIPDPRCGGMFEALGTLGTGVHGLGKVHGVLGRSDTGTGVTGTTDTNIGIGGIATNDGDITNYGGRFEAKGKTGCGVYGLASNSGETGNYDVRNHGGFFEARGYGGIGVYGIGRWGGWFESNKNDSDFGGVGIIARGSRASAILYGELVICSYETNETLIRLGEGLDYAEGFNVSDKNKICPGSVLVIDPDNPGKLRLSEKPYDTKVSGIVAGAKGLESGIRLGSEQFDCNVALAGRVYCNVDSTEAEVQPGDLLTTSAKPGYAMKVADYTRAQGAILGKAMEKLEKGKKAQILVLVTLQ